MQIWRNVALTLIAGALVGLALLQGQGWWQQQQDRQDAQGFVETACELYEPGLDVDDFSDAQIVAEAAAQLDGGFRQFADAFGTLNAYKTLTETDPENVTAEVAQQLILDVSSVAGVIDGVCEFRVPSS